MIWKEWDDNLDEDYLYIIKSEINLDLWESEGPLGHRDDEFLEMQPKITYRLIYYPIFDAWRDYINTNHHPGYHFSYFQVEKYDAKD